jgi:hypothetical protein
MHVARARRSSSPPLLLSSRPASREGPLEIIRARDARDFPFLARERKENRNTGSRENAAWRISQLTLRAFRTCARLFQTRPRATLECINLGFE